MKKVKVLVTQLCLTFGNPMACKPTSILCVIPARFLMIHFSSAQFSGSVMSNSLRPHGPQHARPPCPSPTPGIHTNSCPLVGDAIQPSHPLLSPSPTFNLSQHQDLFQRVRSSPQVAKVLEFQLQHQSFQ